MKSFYSGGGSTSNSYGGGNSGGSVVNSNSPNFNHLNAAVSPINSPSETLLMRYLRSGSPSDYDHSSIKSRPIMNYYKSSSSSNSNKSPLSTVDQNLKDDVLVMDGILVDSTNSGSKRVGKFRSSAILDSSVISGSNLYKTEFCLPWEKENTEGYRYSHKIQSARAKENKRPNNRAGDKLKFDIKHFDPYYSPSSSSYTSRSSTYQSPQSSSAKSRLDAMVTPSPPKAINLKFNEDLTVQSKAAHSPTVSHDLSGVDWSPLDDDIAVKLPSTDYDPSKNDVDEYIQSVLYGPRKKERPPYVLLDD